MIIKFNPGEASHPEPGEAQSGHPMSHNIKFTEPGCGEGSNVMRSGGAAGFGYPMDAENAHNRIPVYPGVPSYMEITKE